MTRKDLVELIRKKRSFLCVGLDTDIEKIPPHLLHLPDPVFEFNRRIIDATNDLCVAYKINTAFYESSGVKGWQSMKKTWEYIPKNIFTIADAKRGDIGNTSAMYARAFFDKNHSGFGYDALTVSPYMGEDSVLPFLQYQHKWVIVLALTSNKGSNDFQQRQTDGEKLYEAVIRKTKQWGHPDNTMLVVGATHPDVFAHIRKLVPDHFLLVPGVGAQGGDLQQIAAHGMNNECGLLVNVSRNIIYADTTEDFAGAARNEALQYQATMSALLSV
ncbi:MAG: orotidine-5'-phosphate decarboxylase [Chitinophagales bacterium]|nr:orotidine-5'-phosphate decarboxylase [Chitinophagales bacterium]